MWLEQRKALLNSIKSNFDKFKKEETEGTNYYRNKSMEYQKDILNLEKIITNLEESKLTFKDVYADVINELDYISNIVSRLDKVEVDTYNLERRLDILSKLFLNKSLKGEGLDKATQKSNVFFVLKPELKEVRDKLYDTLEEYNSKCFEKISKIVSDNQFLKEMARQDALQITDPETGEILRKEEAVQKIIDLIEKVHMEKHLWRFATEQALGANWQGIFSQILRLTKDVYDIEELGKIQSSQKVIQQHLPNFKKSGLNVDIFTGKNEYGGEGNHLTHKYSSRWFRHQNSQEREETLFHKTIDPNRRINIYKGLMEEKKKNEEVIDFTKIKSIKDKFSETHVYKDAFSTDESEMSSYETRLRDVLGDLFFDELVKVQVQKLEDYQNLYENHIDEFSGEINKKNPLKFLEHFNSERYNKPIGTEWKKNENDKYELIKEGTYLFPDYTVSIPKTEIEGKDSKFYSEDFKTIENNESAFAIWKELETLYREVINPVLRKSGFNISQNGIDLPKIENYMRSTLFHNLNTGKKSLAHVGNLWTMYKNMFTASKGQGKTEVKVNYSDTLEKRSRDMAKTFMGYSLDKLLDIASKEKIKRLDKTDSGKTLIDREGIKYIQDNIAQLQADLEEAQIAGGQKVYDARRNLKSYEKEIKSSLAESIANSRVYQYADADILSVTQALGDACARAASNEKSLAVSNLLQNFLNTSATQTTDKTRQRNIMKTSHYLNLWTDTNILGNSNANEINWVHSILNTKSGQVTKKIVQTLTGGHFGENIGERFSKVDKNVKKFLKEELKNVDSEEGFSFWTDGTHYEKEGNDFFINVYDEFGKGKIPVEKSVFVEKYSQYIGEKMAKLGDPVTIGAILNGWVGTKAIAALGLNLPAGVMNRAFGVAINRTFAASGRYGFTTQQLNYATNFMAMSNMDRYLTEGFLHLPSGTRGADIANGIKTFKLFANSLGMIQNRLNDIDSLSDSKPKEGFNIMDWAVNFAEFRNQGELILCEMQNHFLEYQDENGNTIQVPIFDGETGKFVYKPGTLILKDEYRTPENIRIWENFGVVEGEKNPHLRLILNARANVERSQGNYYDQDRAIIMASQIGRAGIMFKRFMAEQISNSFGKIDYDIVKGGMTYEGRHRTLLKYTPTSAIVFGLMGMAAGISGGGLIGLLGLTGVVAGGIGGFAGGAGVGTFASILTKYALKERALDYEGKALSMIEETKNAISVFTEIIMRTFDKPVHVFMRGSQRNLYDIEKATQKIDEKLKLATTKEQRKIITESAQDVATLFYGTGIMVLLSVMTRLIGELLTGAGDDDDEETYKAKMEGYERVINFIINRGGFFQQDMVRSVDMIGNPNIFLDDMKPSMLNTLESGYKMIKNGRNWLKDEGDFTPFLYESLKFLPQPIPNQVVDPILKEGKSPIQNPRMFQKPWWYPVAGTSEQNAKSAVTYQKKKLTENMVDVYKKEFIKELEQMSTEFQNEFASNKRERNAKIESLANIAATKEKNNRRNDDGEFLYKKYPQETFAQFYKRVDLKEERKKWSKGEVEVLYGLEDMLMETEMKKIKQQKQKEIYEDMFGDEVE